MKNLSILTFINIIFSITLVSIIGLFTLFLKFEEQRFQHLRYDKFNLISNSFLTKFEHHPTNKELNQLANTLTLTPITNREDNIYILNYAKTIYKNEKQNFRVRAFEVDQKCYLYIQSIGYNLMFKLTKQTNHNFEIATVLFTLIFLTIIAIYFIVRRKLRPLKTLSQNIQSFKDGNLSIKSEISSKDEIGQISKSFEEATNNIKQLIDSKNLFMKNIIHELKTPITKGLFLANMIETKNKTDKEALVNNFQTLNSIITQLSNIEKLKVNHLQIPKEKIDIKNSLENIIYILGVDETQVNYSISEEFDLIANKDLFSTLLKNLIENGIKYTQQSPILVEVCKEYICVKSKGEKLKNDLDYYTQEFVQEKKNSQGFGLGLYIVNEIAKLHSFKLNYEFKDKYNCFRLDI